MSGQLRVVWHLLGVDRNRKQLGKKKTFFIKKKLLQNQVKIYQNLLFKDSSHFVRMVLECSGVVWCVWTHYCCSSALHPSLSLTGCSGMLVLSATSSSFAFTSLVLSVLGSSEGSCSIGVSSWGSSGPAGVGSADSSHLACCGGGARLCFCWLI